MGQRTALILAREEIGLTRPQLAAALKTSRQYIYDVEAGHRNPSFYYMVRWLKVLGEDASLDLFRASLVATDRRLHRRRLTATAAE